MTREEYQQETIEIQQLHERRIITRRERDHQLRQLDRRFNAAQRQADQDARRGK